MVLIYKPKNLLSVVLGFLTQYNFCFYAAFLAIVMVILMLKRKEKGKLWKYILQYIISAVIGIILFAPAIYHIFFSYRGLGGRAREFTNIEALIGFLKNLFNAFSLPVKFGAILAVILFVIFIFKFVNSKEKGVYSILVFPAILTFLMLVVMSPYKSLRYIMFLLPIISMIFVILLDDFIDNKKFSTIVLTCFAVYLSVYGIVSTPINYLYIGYQNYLDIAEENKNDRFVLVSSTVFSHIQDVPEFQIYKESLIIEPDKLEDLEELNEFDDETEFILGIKNWVDKPEDEVLDEVLKYTGYGDYELLYTSTKSARLTVYKIYR